ncbi:MAG: hypothetical protein ACJ77K_05390 [Bacteroidia bacterium]
MNFLKKVTFISVILVFAALCMSCFCRGPKLTRQLINDSDLIFEGKLVKADTTHLPEWEVNSSFTFKVKKIYKGEPLKNVVVHSDVSSCGLLLYKCDKQEFREILDKNYLVYCKKEDGKYTWTYCRDRIAYSYDPSPNYWEAKSLRKKKDQGCLADYQRELSELDSLIKSK